MAPPLGEEGRAEAPVGVADAQRHEAAHALHDELADHHGHLAPESGGRLRLQDVFLRVVLLPEEGGQVGGGRPRVCHRGCEVGEGERGGGEGGE